MTTLRLATPDDAAAVRTIYAPVVERTATSFELEVPDEAEVAARIRRALERAPWLLAEEDGACLGYAYAVPFRVRPAYAWTLETSVYVHEDHRRRRVARSLYEALLAVLELQGFHLLVAGITLPNDASVALHESLGFEPVGVFRDVGLKLGAWRSVGFWERRLRRLPVDPPPPRGLEEVAREAAFARALAAGAAAIQSTPERKR